MKTLLFALVPLAAMTAAGQVIVNLNNYLPGCVNSPVYSPEPGNPALSKTGNTSAGTPAGSQTYGGWPLYEPVYRPQLFYASGFQPESLLVPADHPPTGFIIVGHLGRLFPTPIAIPLTLGGSATFQVRVWDNSSGGYTNWALAEPAWQSGLIAAGKSPTLSIASLAATNNLCGLLSFNLYYYPPSITSQPTNRTVQPGQTASFAAGATGLAPLNYQWRFNGNPLPGATNSTCAITNAQSTNTGPYDVIVTNTVGSVTSVVAILTVTNFPPVAIATADKTNGVAPLTVCFDGSQSYDPEGGALTYFWNPDDGAGFVTNAAFCHTYSQPGDYQVRVTVIDERNASDMTMLSITVTNPPVFRVITTQPVSQTVLAGQDATFTVSATGTEPVTYQWRFNGTNLTGFTNTSCAIANAQTNNAGPYTVVVTDLFGSTTSSVATLTILVGPHVLTELATAVTTNSATLNGAVNTNWLPSTAWFEWGTWTNYGYATTPLALSGAIRPVTVSVPLTGLAFGTTFHFRLVATNNSGVAYGGDQQFTTAIVPGAATISSVLTITNPTPAADDDFGRCVAAWGTDRLLVGAPGDNTGATDAGAAYVFNLNGTLLTTFTNPTPAAGGGFGCSLAGVGSYQALVGAYQSAVGATNAGTAYRLNTNGVLLTTFTNPAAAASDHFACCVAARGTDILAGACGKDAGATNAGAAYRFDINGGLLTTFTNPAPANDDYFGSSLAAVGTDMVLIGAPYKDLGATNSGAVYLFSATGIPAARENQTAVWTGSNMIIWGGFNGYNNTDGYLKVNDGWRYNPAADTWSPVTTLGAPAARMGDSAVWTGTEMIVWGGEQGFPSLDGGTRYLNDGARYDPVSNGWRPVGTTNAPAARTGHSAVWTGSEMIVWGGYNDSGYLKDGARYNPATDTWAALSTTNAPAGRESHTAVWTGSEMIVWGGENNSGLLNSGARYNPSTDTWNPVSTSHSPTAGTGYTAVWTGGEMIVWGGYGARYDPVADSWGAINTNNAPGVRWNHTAVWTGSEMIVWGGCGWDFLNDGERYDPTADQWTALNTNGAPVVRYDHTAIWTGSNMIVWGGAGYHRLNDGGRYNPSADAWVAVATNVSPNGALFTTFTDPVPAAEDLFGYSIAVVGNDRFLVGAPYADIGASNAGAAYLFDWSGNLMATFANPTPEIGDNFGWSVAAVGPKRVIIGAPYKDAGGVDSGAAYLFDLEGNLLLTVTNPVAADADYFGCSLAGVGTSQFLIGAYGNDRGATNSGAAYLFVLNNQRPVVEAGADQTIYAGDTAYLRGLASDPEGDAIVAWSWDVVSAPEGSIWNLWVSDRPTTSLQALTAGDFVLALAVVDENGNYSLPDYVTIHVHSNLPPVAIATADRTNGAAPLTVCFDSSQSYDPEGGPLNYFWNPGDGAYFETNATFCHTYSQPGDYQVRVTVIDERNASDMTMLSITVTNPPVFRVITTQPVSQTVLAGQDATFTVSATGTEPVTYQWRFNGTNLAGFTNTSCMITDARTNNAGPYTVVVTDLFGSTTSSVATLTVLVGPYVLTEPATDVTTHSATLNGAVNTNYLPSTAWFEWGTCTNYGHATAPVALYSDIRPVTFSVPLSGFAFSTTFHFRLVATNSSGVVCGGDLQFTTAAYDTNGPFAAFTAIPLVALCSQPVVFDASSSHHGQPDHAIVSYEWDFDCHPPLGVNFQLEALGRNVTHAFLSVGTYNVVLRVIDDQHFESIAEHEITVVATVLRVELTSTNTVLVAWPAALTGYDIEQNADLITTNWLAVTNAPEVVGDEKQVLVPPASSRNFYRLHKP